MNTGKIASMRPSGYYMRKALRSTDNPEDLREIALHCVAEYERLREWVRSNGLIPPKFQILDLEAEEKGLSQSESTEAPTQGHRQAVPR